MKKIMPASAPNISFEFFPPRNANGERSLQRAVATLRELRPEFCSVTYGAGGSTRDGTLKTVCEIQSAGVATAAHLSMGADSDDNIGSLLGEYSNAGVRRIVALRGDAGGSADPTITSGSTDDPGNAGSTATRYAEQLMRFIRDHSGDLFHVSVAAYPETHPDAASPDADMAFFKRKVDAGADSAITQYFYNASAYYDFVDRAVASGINIPILPGIMPITNYAALARFSERAGADIPRWLGKRLESLESDPKGLVEFGQNVVTRLCEELLANGAPGLHFYTLNRAKASKAIIHNLGLR
jgi:methylenetetrahydrofolate reductase (NADPH)